MAQVHATLLFSGTQRFRAVGPVRHNFNNKRKEPRLHSLTHFEGLRAADIKLLKKAEIEVGHGVIVHFYPHQTVSILSRTELAAANRPLTDIRRTNFGVRRDGAGFKFVVTRISYFE